MDMKNESGFQTKPRKKIKFDPRNLIILAMGISLAVLGVKTSELDKALTEDEEYISAEASRVFEYYGEKDVINLADPTYGDTWLAALSDVPRHEMDFDNVRLENGFKNYYIDGVKANKTGIDVSYHQGDIDWEAVLNEIGDYEIMYPVVFDWEIVGDESARTNVVSADVLNECAAAFCNRIARGGHIPMVYSVKKMALTKFDMSRLAGFDFWLAEYRDIPEYPYYFTMWQYASDGHVNGIEGEVDLNMSLVDYSEVKR